MLSGGNVTVMVSDMERAIAFYTDTLGLKLQYRGGASWTSIEAGGGLVIGLHLAGEHSPAPGTSGAMSIGFDVSDALEGEVARLRDLGVEFHGPIVDDEKGGVRLAFFGDPDGNALYLCQTPAA